MTSFGLVFLAVWAGALLLLRSKALPWMLSASIAFPATAALNISSTGIYPFFACAVAVSAVLLLRLTLRSKPAANIHQPGRVLLLLFLGWTFVITLLGPTIFAGIEVLAARGGTDNEIENPSSLTYTVSNAAQLIYLSLGIFTAHYLARLNKLKPNLAAIGLGLGMGVSFIQLLDPRGGLPLLTEFFSNSPTTRYIDYTPSGDLRFRGIFTEPAQLVTFATVATVFFVTIAASTRGAKRFWAVVFALISGVNLMSSDTATGLIGAALVVICAILFGIHRFLTRKAKLNPILLIGSLLGFAAFLVYGSSIVTRSYNFFQEKLEGSSYADRSATTDFSLDLASDTFFIGVGLGSNRPSSFLPMMLSCVGLIGTVLFILAISRIMHAAWKNVEFRPTVYALLAFFITKLIGGSNLSEPVMWLCIGICAYAAWNPHAKVEIPQPRVAKTHS